MQLSELYGLVRRQSRGWREATNLVCNCSGGDGDHAPTCPLWEDETE